GLATVVLLTALLVGCGGAARQPVPPSASAPPSRVAAAAYPVRVADTVALRPHPAARVVSRWVRVLRDLDERRALAWRQGRPELLRDVYPAGSAVLRRDRRMLAAYVARGLRVWGVRLTFLAVTEMARRRRSVDLLVVDVLGPAEAVGGGHRFALPHDNPTRQLVTLVHAPRGWRIATVRAR
ncbi:MAG: hypothetical protein ACRDQ1_12810, partial [Sciscionella sp.]